MKILTTRYYPFTLELRAPAVLTCIGGDPNSASTLDYVPGSCLRGAVARVLLRSNEGWQDPAFEPGFRSLILDGTVRYLNAYAVANGHRGLPIPLGLRVEKHARQTDAPIQAHDLAAYDGEPGEDHDVERHWPKVQLGGSPARHVTIGSTQWQRASARIGSRVHQQRDRERGRAWSRQVGGRLESRGTIFVYESLQEGQQFAGLVQVRGVDPEEIDGTFGRVREALGEGAEAGLLVGRSRRAGYGADASVFWQPPRAREAEDERVLNGEDLTPGQEFQLLLTAPYVGRDELTGQLDPAALADEVVRRLGNRVHVVRKRWGFGSVGGFNRAWGLEVPQALAAAAGSVLVLRATGRIPNDDLKRLEDEGVGEKLAEGFGRLLFLPAPALSREVVEATPDLPVVAPMGSPPPLLEDMQLRILRQRLQRRYEDKALLTVRSIHRPPTSSLIGRLRVPLRGDAETALQTLREWLTRDGNTARPLRRPALDALDRCRIGSSSLSSWLKKMAGEAGEPLFGTDLATDLELESLVRGAQLVPESQARQLLERDQAQVRARFIDETLAAMGRIVRRKGD